MQHLRDFVIPLVAAVMVGILVWAYLDRRLRNTVVLSNASLSSRETEIPEDEPAQDSARRYSLKSA